MTAFEGWTSPDRTLVISHSKGATVPLLARRRRALGHDLNRDESLPGREVDATAEARRDERAEAQRLEEVGLGDDPAGGGVPPRDLFRVVGCEYCELDRLPLDVLLRVRQQQDALVLRPDQWLERAGHVVDHPRRFHLARGLVDLDAGNLADAHVRRIDHAVLGIGLRL